MIPTSLHILGKTWVVEKAPEDFTDAGSCSRDFQKITISTSQPEENIKDTFLHEVLHAVDYCMATKLTEDQVASLATGLLVVFLDNPAFLEFLNVGSTTSRDTGPRKRSDRTSKPKRTNTGSSARKG